MSDQALGVLVDAIEVLRTSIRTKLIQAGPEDQPEEQQKLFDVICSSLKRLALDPEGIDMVIHPPPSPETDDRAVVILEAVERAFAPELQQLRDLAFERRSPMHDAQIAHRCKGEAARRDITKEIAP
jgi:hypothetical protein